MLSRSAKMPRLFIFPYGFYPNFPRALLPVAEAAGARFG